MADNPIDRYDLLIVVQGKDELSGSLKRITESIEGAKKSGATAFGPQGQTQKALSGAAAKTKAAAKSSSEYQKALDVLSAATKNTSAVQRAFGEVGEALDVGYLKQLASAKSFADVQTTLAKAFGITKQSAQLYAQAEKEIPGQLAQTSAAVRIATAAKRILARQDREQAAQQRAQTRAEQEAARATKARTAEAARAAGTSYGVISNSLRDVALNQRLMGNASREASERLVRELGGATVSVGTQLGRLAGQTTYLGNTLARQVVRGSGEATDALGALLSRTTRIQQENERYSRSVEAASKLPAKQAEAAIRAAGAVRDHEIAMINGAAAAAKLSLAVGGATIFIAASAVAALGLGAALNSLARRALEASRAFDIVATRAPREAFEGLKDQVFEISSELGLAFDRVADAQGRALLKTGGDAEKSAILLKQASRTALAAFTSPERAVENLGDVVRNYGLEIERVSDVSDALLILQRTAREDFDTLASGLGTVTPVAKELGIEFQELASLVAGMAAEGLSAQQAIFGLRTDLSNFAQDTSPVSERIQQITGELPRSIIATRGFVRGIREMEAALRRNGESLKDFFGESRKSGPIFSLLASGGAKAEGALLQMKSGVDQAAEAIRNLQEPAGRELRELINAIQNEATQLGGTLLDNLVPVVRELAALIKTLTEFLRDLNREMPLVAQGAGAMAKALVPPIAALDIFIKTSPTFFRGLRTGVDLLRDSLGLARQAAEETKEAVQAVTAVPAAEVPPPPLSAELATQAERFQKALDTQRLVEFVERMDRLRDKSGSAEIFLRTLVERIVATGRATRIASVLMGQYARESEKARREIEKQITLDAHETRKELDQAIDDALKS